MPNRHKILSNQLPPSIYTGIMFVRTQASTSYRKMKCTTTPTHFDANAWLQFHQYFFFKQPLNIHDIAKQASIIAKHRQNTSS